MTLRTPWRPSAPLPSCSAWSGSPPGPCARPGWPRPGAGRRSQQRETLALDRTRRLHLVACDGRDLLLLTGGATDVVVGWLPLREGEA